MIAIIDYGRGNLGSVEKAFARLGVPATVTQDPRAVDDARAVVLPGDGAFHDAMANLQTLGLLAPLRRALAGTRPFLGICLGYQLLFTSRSALGRLLETRPVRVGLALLMIAYLMIVAQPSTKQFIYFQF